METSKFQVLNTQSSIKWVGRKVTGAHNGTIDIKDGNLTLLDQKLAGGTIVADTSSIKVLDITDPDTKTQFTGHLASDDFFSIDKYPEAVLEITAVTGSKVKGNLAIKEITHPIEFEAKISIREDLFHLSSTFFVDRTKYEMKFRSGNFFQNLGDNLIYNDFELEVDLTARRQELNIPTEKQESHAIRQN